MAAGFAGRKRSRAVVAFALCFSTWLRLTREDLTDTEGRADDRGSGRPTGPGQTERFAALRVRTDARDAARLA